MDEREVIKEIRWQFSKGKSRAEITRDLQKKNLRLEFIDSLISRAERQKRMIKGVIYLSLLIVFIWIGVYSIFFYHESEIFEYRPTWKDSGETNYTSENMIVITPELISLVAQEIGAGKLRRNPLNLKKPIINFEISGREFYTTIDKRIETKEGRSNEADVSFETTEEIIQKVFLSEDIRESIKTAVMEGSITIQKISSEQELFLKGYLGLYNELNN